MIFRQNLCSDIVVFSLFCEQQLTNKLRKIINAWIFNEWIIVLFECSDIPWLGRTRFGRYSLIAGRRIYWRSWCWKEKWRPGTTESQSVSQVAVCEKKRRRRLLQIRTRKWQQCFHDTCCSVDICSDAPCVWEQWAFERLLISQIMNSGQQKGNDPCRCSQ